ncbi:serine/arginine repetitive matrix protein 2-like [Rhipicephalus sanguineus]|uniref:serine/arginine repetitive matrix protein 2-like n=1 Tax=Rhipicephalus sanguineus TaxID=34632 RepID=UPI0020C54EB5|nr:serine/arginine repetitive matrix protein 2-like [Rhipicephalus sanguineus]
MNPSDFLTSFCLVFLGTWSSSLASKEPFFTHMAPCVGEPITAVSVPQKDQAALSAWNNLFRQNAAGSGAGFAQLFQKAKSIATSSSVLLRRWNRCLAAVCVPDTSLQSVSCRALYFSYNPHKHTCTPQRGFCQRTINHFASMEDCRIACTSPKESGRAATMPTPQDTEVRLIIMRKRNGASVTLVNSTLKVPQKKNLFFVGYLLPDPYGPLVGMPKSSVHRQSSVTKVAVKKPEATKAHTPSSATKQSLPSPVGGLTGFPQGSLSTSKPLPQPQFPKQVPGMLGVGPMAGQQASIGDRFPSLPNLPNLPAQKPATFLFEAQGQQPNVPSGPLLKETGASEIPAVGKKIVSAMPSTGQTGPLVSDKRPALSSAQPPINALISGVPLSPPPSAMQGPLSEASRAPLPMPSGRAGDSPNTSKPRQLSDMSTPTLPPGMVDPYLTDSPISPRAGKSASDSSEEDESDASSSNSSNDDEATERAESTSNTSESGPEEDSGKVRHARELPPGLARTRRGKDEKTHRVAPMSRRSAREGPSREPVVEEKIVPERAQLTGMRTAYRRSVAASFPTSSRRRGNGGLLSTRWAQPRGSRFHSSISL